MDQSSDNFECPLCGTALVNQDNELWCPLNRRSFGEAEVNKAQEWRSFGMAQKVAVFKALGADTTKQTYFLQPSQLAEVERLTEEASTARPAGRESVAPHKQALLALARGVTDGGALRELVDNASDAGIKKRPGQQVTVSINFDSVLRSLTISDDAGGMERADLLRCLTLGAEKIDHFEGEMGRYGIGAKEAIYHFGREVIIRSRTAEAAFGLRTVVPEEWLEDQDWNIKIEHVEVAEPGTTSIEIGRLFTTDHDSGTLRRKLWDTYEPRIRSGLLRIKLNDEFVLQELEYVPLYPPELYPRRYEMRVGRVKVSVNVLLIKRPADLSGLFLMAQQRRFVHLRWNDARARLIFEKIPKHALADHIRVEVDFEGPIEDIPINANKDDLRTNGVLETVAPIITRLVDPYFKAIPTLSRKNQGTVNSFERASPSSEAKVDDPVRDLGRVSSRSTVPNEYRANLEQFKAFFNELDPPNPPDPPDPPDPPIPPDPPDPPIPPVPPDPPKPEGLEPKPNVPKLQKNTYQRLDASIAVPRVDPQLRESIEKWLRIGDDLGIEIARTWTNETKID